MDYPGKVITKNQVTPTQISATGVWTLDDAAAAVKNNNWPVAGVPNPISKSLRFNTPDAAYLNRTPASASNRKTWTWSGWVKRSAIGSGVQQGLIGCSSGTTDSTFMNFQFTGDRLGLGLYTQYILLTTQLFRDVGAWYHIVVALDTTNATADNRCRMYINGVEVTVFTTRNNPTLNADYGINQATQHDIGRAEYTNSTCMGGYMTEINFIDGQALTPSSFGMTDPVTGVWEPLKYSGTYGTNGFYLNFKDATSTTTLGYDYSGNANNWTTNNFSVTAGAGNDSLTDVPTPWVAYNTTGDIGGVIRGNYCTFNPLVGTHSNTYSDGNLQVATSTVNAAFSNQRATFGVSSGKWYWEITCQATNSAFYVMGITADTVNPDTQYVGQGNSYSYRNDTGQKATGGTFSAYGATFTTGDIISVVFDADAGTLVFYKNGATQGTAFTGISGTYFPAVSDLNNDTGRNSTFIANFGQRPFAYTPPTGFRSLCTTNLPATAIGFGLTNQAGKYMNVVTFNGNGASNAITGVGFQPDFVWVKSRSNAYSHNLHDVIRGPSSYLVSNSTAAENTSYTNICQFTSDGFTLSADNSANVAGTTDVGWSWRASNAAGVSNTAGTITSTVSANTTSGFSIVTYTGTGTNGATVGHGLGVAPDMIIVKRRNSTGQWATYHTSIGNTGALRLNATSATITDVSFWNNTSPTSTVFTIGVDGDVNTNTGTYVAYCFDAVPGYSAFGSYTGNGSATGDGPFVYLGFRPRYVLAKVASNQINATNWQIWDALRPTYNVASDYLFANASDAESNSAPTYHAIDFLSNGFKLRCVDTYGFNQSGAVYIYAAFAESPFQFANAR